MGKNPSCALVLGAIFSCLLLSTNVNAGLLIGTYGPNFTQEGNLSVAQINALIDNYNDNDLGPAVPLPVISDASFLGDVETDDGSTSGFGSQLTYYTGTQVGLDQGNFNVFDAGVSLTNGISNSTITAFNYTGTVPFYYLVKDGSYGVSLFLAMTGFNAAYIDEGDGPSSLDAAARSSYTYGSTDNETLSFDPYDSGQAGVSNIRFFVAGDTPPQANVVPEPGTFVMFGAGMLLVGFRRRFRAA